MQLVQTKIIDSIARVTIRRDDGLNALSTQLMEELRDTARRLADDTALAAVVLTGEPVFSSGADLVEASNGDAHALSQGDLRHLLKLGPDLCRAWEEIEAYTIAAIEGHCIGGGAALAAALDYRILGASAFFRLPEVPLGLNMSWQTIPRLVAQIGPARTKEYVIFGKRIDAAQALAWGLCEKIVADGGAAAAALGMAQEVRSLPRTPVRMTKQAVNATAYALAHATSFMDRDQCALAMQAEEFRASLTAFRGRNQSASSNKNGKGKRV